MTRTSCEQEANILAMSRRGSLSDSQRHHVSICPVCAGAVRADSILRLETATLPRLDALPDPALVWWRARQQTRLQRVQRATLPIRIVERFALACGGFALAVGSSQVWSALRSAAERWIGAWVAAVPSGVPTEGSAVWLALGSAILLLIVFGLYSQWAEG